LGAELDIGYVKTRRFLTISRHNNGNNKASVINNIGNNIKNRVCWVKSLMTIDLL
jgi:hypothetical protein